MSWVSTISTLPLPPLQPHLPTMWYNRPVYNGYTPSGYGHWSFEDPYARAIARERAAREREAAARHAELRWQQTQDAARSPYNSYLGDDNGSFVPYPYDPHTNNYTTYEDLERRQALERQRQLELARQAELNRREEERDGDPEEYVSQQHKVSLVSSS